MILGQLAQGTCWVITYNFQVCWGKKVEILPFVITLKEKLEYVTVMVTLPLLFSVLSIDKIKHNLLSICQLCDKSYNHIWSIKMLDCSWFGWKPTFVGYKHENIYIIDIDACISFESCFVIISMIVGCCIDA